MLSDTFGYNNIPMWVFAMYLLFYSLVKIYSLGTGLTIKIAIKGDKLEFYKKCPKRFLNVYSNFYAIFILPNSWPITVNFLCFLYKSTYKKL